VARLAAGEDLLSPRLEVLASDLLDPPLRERVRRRLAAWLDGHLRRVLAPLYAARDGAPAGAARGLAFALGESLGSVPRHAVAAQLALLGPGERHVLQQLGVVVGGRSVYLPALLGPPAVRLRGILWAARSAAPRAPLGDAPPSVPVDAAVPARGYEACGYRIAGPRAVRVDRLEWLLAVARRLARGGPFAPTRETTSILGAGDAEVAAVLAAAGYVAGPDGRLTRREPSRRAPPARKPAPPATSRRRS
jgi:ATP-dependent RNA helicase SUPV3L1/SUV3